MHMTVRAPASPPDITLPPADTKRWSPSRKAAVVAAARAGLISREEACARYLLSDEELVAWEQALDQNGVPGLRSTRLQSYRYTRIPSTRQEQLTGAAQQQLRYR
jgi:Protein of unknown function (DUF1153)